MSIVLFLFLFGYCLGIPTTERNVLGNFELLPDPLELDNLLISYMNGNNGELYLINRTKTVSYLDAVYQCNRYNMDLVIIDNEEKNSLIINLLKRYTSDGDGPFWMSGSRLTDTETWRWVNDEPVGFFNWAYKEPNNAKGDEMCIELYRDNAAWNDERCSIENGFVCEKISKVSLHSSYEPFLDSNDIIHTENGEVGDSWQDSIGDSENIGAPKSYSDSLIKEVYNENAGENPESTKVIYDGALVLERQSSNTEEIDDALDSTEAKPIEWDSILGVAYNGESDKNSETTKIKHNPISLSEWNMLDHTSDVVATEEKEVDKEGWTDKYISHDPRYSWQPISNDKYEKEYLSK